MEGRKKIEYILTELGIKAPTFANNVGLKYQRILDIQIGKTKKISGEVANAIHTAYPQFTTQWLLTSEGKMLLPSPSKLTIAREEALPYTKIDLQTEKESVGLVINDSKQIAKNQQTGYGEIEELLNHYKNDCEALRQDCANLRRDIESLNSKIKAMEEYRDELEQENDKLIRNEGKLQTEVNKLRQEKGLSPYDFLKTRNLKR